MALTAELLLFLELLLVLSTKSNECIPRDYGQGGTVCVCNATYCDIIERHQPLLPRQYLLSISSKEGLRHQVTRKNFGTKIKSRGVVLTIDPETTYQTIHGFGGAFTDAAGINIKSISDGAQKKLMQSYFGINGSEYTFGRVPMGGSDFSTRPYSYNDNVTDDKSLNHFSLAEEDLQFKIPYIKEAMDLSEGKLKLLGAAWSPPPWMKTNGQFTGVGYLKPEYYDTWAEYFIRFLEEYEKHGIPFWGLSTGNEPSAGSIPFFQWNCLGWSPQSQSDWVSQNIGPKLRQSRFNNTKLLALDDQRIFLPWWLSLMFQDGKASPYIDGIAVHWYWDGLAPSVLLDRTHSNFPNKFLLATEACFTSHFSKKTVLLGSWTRGEQYAESIIDDLSHWVTGWIDWNLVLDENGGPNWAHNYVDAPIIVNATSDEFYKQPMYYALSHFSKFIPPGSLRISLTGATKQLQALAFLTPEEYIVIVALNKRTTDQPISITGIPRGGVANFIVPKKSITTFTCRAKKLPSHKILS